MNDSAFVLEDMLRTKQPTVLVCDDDNHDRYSILLYLNRTWGFNTYESANGLDCLSLLKENHVDIVFLNWVMPNVSGIKVLKQIHRSFPKTKVIMLTSKGDAESGIQAIKSGAEEYIVKPFDTKQIDAALLKIAAQLESDRRFAKSIGPVFISYASEDRDKAKRLSESLQQLGIHTWVDALDIKKGSDWNKSIIQALKSAQYMLAIVTETYGKKEGYVRKEINIALELDAKHDQQKFIIPLLFEETQLPSGLEKYQWIDMRRSDGFAELIKTVL